MAATTIVDPVFGCRVLDTRWVADVPVSVFGTKMRIEVDTAPAYWMSCVDPPSEEQRQIFIQFIKSSSELRIDVESSLYRYYQRVRDLCCDGRTAGEIAEEVPLLRSAAEIWSLLSEPNLLIPNQRVDAETVCLQWNCTWDWNREVEVVVRGTVVQGVRVAGEYDDPS